MITFVKTRYKYDSYTDFWRLVELSQFPIIYVDELDTSKEGVYITAPMNGEWRPHIDNQAHKPRNAHLILWNLERPSGSAGSVGKYARHNRELLEARYADGVWVSDAQLADETRHATRFVVLGSHPELGNPDPKVTKHYDFIHLSAEVNRRQTIYKRFQQSQIAPNSWPPVRDKILQQAKFALNVHQDNHPFQEPLRFALFAAYGLPIISETCFNPHPWQHGETIYTVGYDDLVKTLRTVLNEPYEKWQLMGLKARELMTVHYTFRAMVEKAIIESVGQWR